MILRVDVSPRSIAVSAIYYTVTTPQLLSQLPYTISYERTKLHLTGFMRASAALFSKQLKPISIKIPVTNNLKKWQSLGTPGISCLTLQYSLLLKKCSLFIFGLVSSLYAYLVKFRTFSYYARRS